MPPCSKLLFMRVTASPGFPSSSAAMPRRYKEFALDSKYLGQRKEAASAGQQCKCADYHASHLLHICSTLLFIWKTCLLLMPLCPMRLSSHVTPGHFRDFKK